MGRITIRTRITKHDGQRRGEAHLTFEERQDVDLDAGDCRGVPGAAACRHVDDVECGQGGDHRDGDADADLVPKARNGDGDELLEPACAIDPRRLEESRVDPGHPGEKQHRAESEQDPDPDQAHGRKGEVEVAEPGPGHISETDGCEDLVDQTVQRQESSPDDACSHERNHLRQEEDCPGHRPQPTRRDSVDDAGRHESEGDGNEAIEENEPEGVEERLHEFRLAEDGRVVRQADPGRRTDTVPAV